MKAGRLLRICLAAVMLAAGAVVAGSGPAAAKPTILSSFDTGLGPLVSVGLDPVSGNLFVYGEHDADIVEFTQSGTEVSPRIPFPRPGATSNDFDLDFASEPLTIANTSVPANSLLAVNGDESPEMLYALNKDDGSSVASRTMYSGADPVGLAYHPGRDSLFFVEYNLDELVETPTNDGAVLNRFSLTPSGSDLFTVFYGDVDVNEATGNLLVLGSDIAKIRELTPTGGFVRDIDVSALNMGGMTGIALDSAGNAWISTFSGIVYHVGGIAGEDDPPPECQSDPNAQCGGASNDDFTGTSGDDFIFTGGGDDRADGGAGADDIFGASGNDHLAGGGDDDHLSGGTGKDTLVGDTDTVGRMAEDTPGDDTLDGGAGADELLGQAGDDTLNGGGGNDVLKAGGGTNILRGGPGNDTCVVTNKDTTKSCETIKKKRRSF
jgi:Ca2+-binding RTX toxin-like protein